jgi:hypothetical protein
LSFLSRLLSFSSGRLIVADLVVHVREEAVLSLSN